MSLGFLGIVSLLACKRSLVRNLPWADLRVKYTEANACADCQSARRFHTLN
jgi:hypothetical protein